MGKDCSVCVGGCRDTIGNPMTVDCPVCHGSGECVHGNGVHPQKQLTLEECWLCNGVGKVEEHPTEKMTIKKYYGLMAG